MEHRVLLHSLARTAPANAYQLPAQAEALGFHLHRLDLGHDAMLIDEQAVADLLTAIAEHPEAGTLPAGEPLLAFA